MAWTDHTIASMFAEKVDERPDHEFIVYPDRDLRWTYKQFDERTDALAKGLLSIGIGKGDHVGIWARNVPDWLTFMFATAKIGAVLVTVNTAYKSHELAYVMEQSDMKAIAVIDAYRDVNYIDIMRELVPELAEGERGEIESERFPHLKSVIYIGPEKHKGMYNVPELILLGQHLPSDELDAIEATLDPDDAVNMQYTSGTTGFPKGVMLTSRNVVNNGYYIGERQRFTDQERVVLPAPLFHCFGCVLGVEAILTHGCTAIMIEEFNPLLVLAAIEKERGTAIYGVPTMFIAELNHPMFGMFDYSTLRTGIMAGSPCPIETMKEVMDKMHCPEITIAYGLTEASPVFIQTSTDDPVELRCETVGTAMPHIEVKVVDPETGEECAPGEQGELCCRGYNVMKGYYKMPEATEKAIDKDGWLHSGDLGTVDENGYYRVTGRIKDMIIRGGENIYPREIEEFLYTMEGIEDAQVVGVPDEKYGEVVGAFVRVKEGYELSSEEIRDFALSKLARYKCPKHVFIVDEFPMTHSGKIMKYKLRDMAKELLDVNIGVYSGENDGKSA